MAAVSDRPGFVEAHEFEPRPEFEDYMEPRVAHTAWKVMTVIAAIGFVFLSLALLPLPVALIGAIGVTVGAVFIFDYLNTGSCCHFIRNCRRDGNRSMDGHDVVVVDARRPHRAGATIFVGDTSPAHHTVRVVSHSPAAPPRFGRPLPGLTSVRQGVGTDAAVVTGNLAPPPVRSGRGTAYAPPPPPLVQGRGSGIPVSSFGGTSLHQGVGTDAAVAAHDLPPPPIRGGRGHAVAPPPGRGRGLMGRLIPRGRQVAPPPTRFGHGPSTVVRDDLPPPPSVRGGLRQRLSGGGSRGSERAVVGSRRGGRP